MDNLVAVLVISLQLFFANSLSTREQVLNPKAVPADIEIVNPTRGLYTWLDYHLAPQPEPALDYYKRIPWAALEPQASQYDFKPVESELAKLPEGGTFSFRLMAMNPSWSWENGSNVPAYLMAGMDKGFFLPAIARGPRTPSHLYIPDWNSPVFLDRLDKLLAALGQKYDGDPRIGFIDIGIYGAYGEWHTFGIPNFPKGAIPYGDVRLNPHGAAPATFESRKRIIDAHVNAFHKTRLTMMTDDKEALAYALRLPCPIPVGMRRDSFGSNHFSRDFLGEEMPKADQDLVLSRWKTAPLMVESFGQPQSFQAGPLGLLEQVEKYHIAAIGNGNFASRWDDIFTKDQNAVLAAGRRAGYRFVLVEAAIPQDLVHGDVDREGGIPLRTLWMNEGVTPAYDHWKVEFSLWKEHSKNPAASVISTLNLEAFLPTAQPSEIRDTLQPVKKLSKGIYELRVKVTDPRRYRRPLRLAIEGETPDGAYSLGSVQID